MVLENAWPGHLLAWAALSLAFPPCVLLPSVFPQCCVLLSEHFLLRFLDSGVVSDFIG